LSTTYILAVIASVVSLALTQSLITNGTAQLVTGLASTLVPLILALAHSLVHAHVQAAHVAARAPTPPVPPAA
jgi:hypothetical protein